MEKGPNNKAPRKVVSNDVFLNELAEGLRQAATKGSLFVVMKRIEVGPGPEHACLVRCRYRDHKSVTVVGHKDLIRFQTRLAAVQKAAWGNALPKKPSKRSLKTSAAATAAADAAGKRTKG